MNRSSSKSILSETVQFCRALRDDGIAVTPAEVIAAVKALGLLDVTDRLEAFYGLRAVLTTRVEDYPIFERRFDEFWAMMLDTERSPNVVDEDSRRQRDRLGAARRNGGERKGLAFFLKNWAQSTTESEPIAVPSA